MFKTAVAATLFASANAHFFISSPAPITGNAIKDPLDASGSNFPCHGSDVTQGAVTSLTAGSTFPLKYELGVGGVNTAVHGGGSCQISLSYETDATKLKDPANWKVIASFIGGCPTDATGNLDTAAMCNGSNAPKCVNALNFKVPAEVTNGNAILAWTWFNNVGNREMYMNCAKVSVSGGTGSMGSLPSMFVANLASVNTCATTENKNVDFPNPGAYVTKENPPNFPLLAPVGSCGSGSGSANVPSTGGSGTSAAAAAPAASTPAASAPVASSANNGQYTGVGASSAAAPATSKAAGVFAPGASSAPAVAQSATSVIATTFVTAASPAATTQAAATPAAAAPAASPASPAASGAAPASSPATSGSCLSGQVACTASGFYCISQTTFGMCAFGCATPQTMSDGTNCNSGAVVNAVNYPQRRKQIRNVHRRFAAGSL